MAKMKITGRIPDIELIVLGVILMVVCATSYFFTNSYLVPEHKNLDAACTYDCHVSKFLLGFLDFVLMILCVASGMSGVAITAQGIFGINTIQVDAKKR